MSYMCMYFSSSRLLMAEILHYLGCKQVYLNNGISDNYQPQLVISSEFWSMYGISTSYLLDFYGKCRQIYRRILWAIPLYHCIHTHPMSSGFHASQGPSRRPKKHWKGAFWDKENREKPMVKSVAFDKLKPVRMMVQPLRRSAKIWILLMSNIILFWMK